MCLSASPPPPQSLSPSLPPLSPSGASQAPIAGNLPGMGPGGKRLLYSQHSTSDNLRQHPALSLFLSLLGNPRAQGPWLGRARGWPLNPVRKSGGGGQDPLKLMGIKKIQRECWVKTMLQNYSRAQGWEGTALMHFECIQNINLGLGKVKTQVLGSNPSPILSWLSDPSKAPTTGAQLFQL